MCESTVMFWAGILIGSCLTVLLFGLAGVLLKLSRVRKQEPLSTAFNPPLTKKDLEAWRKNALRNRPPTV
jgi:hypothetical protein